VLVKKLYFNTKYVFHFFKIVNRVLLDFLKATLMIIPMPSFFFSTTNAIFGSMGRK
jgi:hypothetical protein